MNANSGMAGPTAAFTSFQSCWLKWLCDTVCAAAHSYSQSLYFVPYLSPASFFFLLSLAMPLFISQLLSFCVISNPQNSTCHCIIFQYGVFIFNRASCQYDFFLCVGAYEVVCFFLSVCVLKWRERCRRTTSNSMCIWIGERAQKCVCVKGLWKVAGWEGCSIYKCLASS